MMNKGKNYLSEVGVEQREPSQWGDKPVQLAAGLKPGKMGRVAARPSQPSVKKWQNLNNESRVNGIQ